MTRTSAGPAAGRRLYGLAAARIAQPRATPAHVVGLLEGRGGARRWGAPAGPTSSSNAQKALTLHPGRRASLSRPVDGISVLAMAELLAVVDSSARGPPSPREEVEKKNKKRARRTPCWAPARRLARHPRLVERLVRQRLADEAEPEPPPPPPPAPSTTRASAASAFAATRCAIHSHWSNSAAAASSPPGARSDLAGTTTITCAATRSVAGRPPSTPPPSPESTILGDATSALPTRRPARRAVGTRPWRRRRAGSTG